MVVLRVFLCHQYVGKAFVKQSHDFMAVILELSICGYTAQSHIATLRYTVTKMASSKPNKAPYISPLFLF